MINCKHERRESGNVGIRPAIRYIEMPFEVAVGVYSTPTWELKDFYIENNGCRTFIWLNKKTGEVRESIGIYSPSEPLGRTE